MLRIILSSFLMSLLPWSPIAFIFIEFLFINFFMVIHK
jgi:hypothetical protein